MTVINLRDFYPFYISDCLIDVPDEVAAARGTEHTGVARTSAKKPDGFFTILRQTWRCKRHSIAV